ncbi:MAG: type II secretion system protein GspE, partial [Deltaproteobacteria bacterium]|nr:type II secretion system protein GspE [Deltaproteobacteria bacterium]
PFLVSSSLLAVMAQRLVRRLCPECREPYALTEAEAHELGLDFKKIGPKTIFRPGTSECKKCQNTHFLGRTGIHELLIIDDEIRSLILQRVDSNTIKSAAVKRGFATLRVDGGREVLEGNTSVEEVLLATHEELVSE